MALLNSTQVASELGVSTPYFYKIASELPKPDAQHGTIKLWEPARIPELRKAMEARSLARKQARTSKKAGIQ